MSCKIAGCQKKISYKAMGVCQMHYFRWMRNGTFERLSKDKNGKVIERKIRIENPKGYQLIYNPDHILAQKNGYVYEHRLVAFDKYGDTLPDCEKCGRTLSWAAYYTHIDHIDNNVRNNSPENLRPLCNGCNVKRGLKPRAKTFTFLGRDMTLYAISKHERCEVSYKGLKERVGNGWSAEYAALTKSRKSKNC